MGIKCRFTHSAAEAATLRETTQANGGVAPTVSALRGPPASTRPGARPYLICLLNVEVFASFFFLVKRVGMGLGDKLRTNEKEESGRILTAR